MLCDSALSRAVRKILSSLWHSVGREPFLIAASTFCMYLYQLSFICNLMRIGIWSELSVNSVCQVHVVVVVCPFQPSSLLIQVLRVYKAQFSYRLDSSVPYISGVKAVG